MVKITLETAGIPVSNMPKRHIQPSFGSNTETSQNDSKHKYILPTGIIAGGGILMYLGVKNFTKTGKLKNYVNEQFKLIDIKRNDYTKFVQDSINSIFPNTTLYIQNFRAARYFSPTPALKALNSSENLTKLIENQDNAFALLAKHYSKFEKGGITPYDKFLTYLEEQRIRVWSQVAPKRDQISMEFNDIANLPDFENGSHTELVKLSREILNGKKDKTIEKMNKYTDDELAHLVKAYATRMTDTIIEIRNSNTNAKENFINDAFKRANRLINSDTETLKPTYSKLPTLEEFSKLTPEQLKPQNVPEELISTFENNTYFQAVLENDFNKLDIEDLKKLFYGSPYENNLKDLGYLIDRLRLRQAIAKVENSDNKEIYNTIIPKLEYLSVKLHEFGEKELIDRCSKDFSNMSPEQKKAALYYVNVVSKHLGYESILKMDSELVKTNYDYKNSNIRSFMELFRKNSDIYFL